MYRNYKDRAVTHYPHGLQPNMYSACPVWSIPFHIFVLSNLFVLAMYLDIVSNTNLSFSFFKTIHRKYLVYVWFRS